VDNLNRYNAHNTFTQLLKMGAIPVVNENDTVATYEIEIGDNDTLSAIVAALIDADLLILLSDIDGLYTDDPRQNPNAEFIEQVDELTEEFMHMGKASTGSNVGTGGMNTKMIAAKIATSSDVDMIIANSKDIGVLIVCYPVKTKVLYSWHIRMKALICRNLYRICTKISDDTSTKRGIHYEYG